MQNTPHLTSSTRSEKNSFTGNLDELLHERKKILRLATKKMIISQKSKSTYVKLESKTMASPGKLLNKLKSEFPSSIKFAKVNLNSGYIIKRTAIMIYPNSGDENTEVSIEKSLIHNNSDKKYNEILLNDLVDSISVIKESNEKNISQDDDDFMKIGRAHV